MKIYPCQDEILELEAFIKGVKYTQNTKANIPNEMEEAEDEDNSDSSDEEQIQQNIYSQAKQDKHNTKPKQQNKNNIQTTLRNETNKYRSIEHAKDNSILKQLSKLQESPINQLDEEESKVETRMRNPAQSATGSFFYKRDKAIL